MEFTVNGKKFTDYNEAKAYEDSLKQKEAEAKRQADLNAQRELYFDEVVNKMNFCVVNFDNDVIKSPAPSVVFAFMTDTAKNKSEFVTMANAYIEETCEKRFYVNEDGSYGEYYTISFINSKSKDYDEISEMTCGAVIDYLLNNGHAFSTSGNLISVNEDYAVMFYDLTGVVKQEEKKSCSGCRGYNCSAGEELSYEDLPAEVKNILNLLGRFIG